MSEENKTTLRKANAAVSEGDHEGFLLFCTEDMEWTTVGSSTLAGKEAVRQWMATEYAEPPQFRVSSLLADGDFVVALGDIAVKDKDGRPTRHSYCDVWRFRDGKIAALTAFVIKPT